MPSERAENKAGTTYVKLYKFAYSRNSTCFYITDTLGEAREKFYKVHPWIEEACVEITETEIIDFSTNESILPNNDIQCVSCLKQRKTEGEITSEMFKKLGWKICAGGYACPECSAKIEQGWGDFMRYVEATRKNKGY